MNLINCTLETILGDDLEKILKTRLNRFVELEALVALYQEFGEGPVRRVVKNALTTYRDRAGKLRHYEKVSAIETLEWMRRQARAEAEWAAIARGLDDAR